MKDIETKIVSDESTFIRQSISNVVSAGVGGALLAVLILYLFIGELIPSFLIGISIPIAVPITFFLLDKQGITLNVMSLGGLALGIGMLVDNSIVVLENIAKKANEGLDSLNAAIEGTSEMLLPVLASTATTIAVFAPLAFVVGVAGQLFSDLAWTIIYSLTCSLAVAVIVLPTLYVLVHKISTTKAGFLSNEAAKNPITNKFQYLILSKPFYQIVRKNGAAWFKDQRAFYIMSLIKVCFGIPWIVFKLFMFFLGDLLRIIFTGAWLLLRTVGVFVIGILIIITKPISVLAKYCKQTINTWEQTTYPNMITKILEKKINVVIGVLLLGVVAIGLGSQMGGDLLPPLSNTKYFLDGELPLGAGIKTSSTTSYAFEEHLIKTEGITNVVALIGVDEAQALIGNAGINKFTVQFDVDTDVFDKEALEKGLRKFTGVNWTLRQRTLGVQSQPLELVITDNDLDRLRRVALNLKNKLDSASFIALANDTISNGVPELTVEINSSIIGPLGLTPGRIVSDLSHYLRGEKATDIEISDKTLPVIVKAAETDIRAAADLDGIKLLTAQRQSVDLGSIASINKGEGPSYVFRTGGARSIRLSYKPVGVSLSEAAQLLQDQIPPSNLDTEYRVEGQSEEYNESMNSLVFALSLAVFMVYLVMASQFESFTQPLYIMGTIPLAFIGVVLAIYPFGLPISIMVLVGCIVLVGIIVNNAIIFIDSTNRMVKSGVEIGVAVVETGRKRLRPILMTTVTTILGLVPMAFATGEGSALTIAMSRTIIGGLGFGTLLTLVFIPVLIMVFANKKSSKGVSA